MGTLKGIIFAAIMLVGASSFSTELSQSDLNLVAQTTLLNMEKINNLDWKVGDTLNFNLVIKPLPFVASAVLQVTQIDKVGITLTEIISYKTLKQVIETVLDPNTGKIVSTKINGKPAKVPTSNGGETRVIVEEESHIKVKAGEFDCIHVVTENQEGNQAEMWINPSEIPINGLLKSSAIAGIATVEMEDSQALSAASKLIFLGLLIGARALAAEKGLSPQTQRAIRESENLSLLKDRLQACTVLARTIKKSNSKEARQDLAMLHEKLNQLSKYFYTDKGFQSFLLGKELFEKQKYADAVEKLSEADDLEKGNIDVLHFLDLSQLWLKKGALADAAVKRALQINPFDVELLRDELAISVNLENWDDALKEGESLIKDSADAAPLTAYFLGLAKIQSGDKSSGEKLMNEAVAKDATLPEPYFNLGGTKFMAKYFELCNVKVPKTIERDPNSCVHLDEAKSAMMTPKSTEAPTPPKKDRQ